MGRAVRRVPERLNHIHEIITYHVRDTNSRSNHRYAPWQTIALEGCGFCGRILHGRVYGYQETETMGRIELIPTSNSTLEAEIILDEASATRGGNVFAPPRAVLVLNTHRERVRAYYEKTARRLGHRPNFGEIMNRFSEKRTGENDTGYSSDSDEETEPFVPMRICAGCKCERVT